MTQPCEVFLKSTVLGLVAKIQNTVTTFA